MFCIFCKMEYDTRMGNLTQKICVACEGGVAPFDAKQVTSYLAQLKTAWDVIDNKKIRRAFMFKDFRVAMVFVNAVAVLAEKEGHHPDIFVSYNNVTIELWTHAIGGLSENDFIVAAKIELLEKTPDGGGGAIPFDDFAKVKLRVGTVAEAKRVEGSEKLLALQVKLGDETRQIIAGIAQWYAPEQLAGKQIVIVANLEPRTLMGMESRGMALAAGGENGVALLVPDKEVPPGSSVR